MRLKRLLSGPLGWVVLLLVVAGGATTITIVASDSDKLAGTTPTAAGLAILDDANAAAQRTTLGAIGGTSGATDNAILRANGTGGSTIKTSTITIGNTGALAGVESINVLGGNLEIGAETEFTGSVTISGNEQLIISNSGSLFLTGSIPSAAVTIKTSDGELVVRNYNDSEYGGITAGYATFSGAVTGIHVLTVDAETIASGAASAESASVAVLDTEAAAASDDLDTISDGAEGQVLIVRAANAARTVVLKDGTGNLKLAGDCTLDNSEDTCTLIFDGTNWLETARSNNGA